MAVRVIKAKRQNFGLDPADTRAVERVRVAAYCRVSTDSEEQETSYDAQCRHYTDYITSNPDWDLASIYADAGISGTSTKHREQFNKMIADCEAGLIDLVITKSISRWARNTLDSLQNIRKLKDLGIPVLFEKENINTMDAKGELLITIMSSIAKQESESISKNVRMGIQYQMQQGKGRLNTAQFLGLTKDPEEGKLVIVPEEAGLVRRIYREYLEGYSPGMIAAHLTSEGIPTPAGKTMWYQSTIVSILENEKYCGALLMQKYFVGDVLTHKIKKNTGQLPQYFVENNHDPVVPKKIFAQVQGEMQRRSMLKNDPCKLRFGSTMALSGRLICGYCGRRLKRYTNPNPALIDWRCRKRAYKKRSVTREVEAHCPCRNVQEQAVKSVIVEAFNRLPNLRDDLIRMQGAAWIGEVKRIEGILGDMKDQRNRVEERLDGLTEAETGEADYLRSELVRMEEKETALLIERAEAANKEVQIRLLLELVDTMCGLVKEEENYLSPACFDYEEFFLRTRYRCEEGILGEDGRLQRFSNDMVIRYLNTVRVLDDGYEVNFKCGLMVKIGIGI